MEPDMILEELSRPAAYPHAFDDFEIHQTHISIVFLVGPFAYKVKKPVELGFLDFSTLDRRLHYCREEVHLNRRLAPEVYLGVVPITRGEEGLQMGGEGEPLEYAVRMRRLPPEATMLAWLERGSLAPRHIEVLARRIASFHSDAERGPEIARHARLEVVARNARDNLEQSRSQRDVTISNRVFDRLGALLEEALVRLGPLIEARVAAGLPRDTHGDLHLDHVFLFPDRPPPGDLVVIDCIEFEPRYRHADPISDVAFLVMDLLYHARSDLAETFVDGYLEASGDEEGRALLPFYVSYRAAVRAKVEGLLTGAEEVPENEREAAAERARGHWLLALGALERPSRRPGLVLITGLPATGKSTIAAELERRAAFRVLSSDVTRKSLIGLLPTESATAPVRMGIYAPEWTERTYRILLREAEAGLRDGERILIDATFGKDADRRNFIALADRLRVPVVVLVCEAPRELALRRLRERGTTASDADERVYAEAAQLWDDPAAEIAARVRSLDTGVALEVSIPAALADLRDVGLAE